MEGDYRLLGTLVVRVRVLQNFAAAVSVAAVMILQIRCFVVFLDNLASSVRTFRIHNIASLTYQLVFVLWSYCYLWEKVNLF